MIHNEIALMVVRTLNKSGCQRVYDISFKQIQCLLIQTDVISEVATPSEI